METEAEATNRAIQLARVAGAPLYVVHVSCQPAVEPIALAREKGWDVWGETCTQYLFVDESALEQPDWEGAKYIYTPPPRPKEHQEHLWKALAIGRALGRLDRPLPVQLARAEGHQRPASSRSSRTAARGSRTGCTCSTTFGVRDGAHHAEPLRRADLDERREAASASTRARARSRPAPTPTSSSGIPRRSSRSRPTTHHSNVNYNLFEGTQVTGAPGGRARPRPGDRRERRARRASRAPASSSSARASARSSAGGRRRSRRERRAGARGLREGGARRRASRSARAPPCSSSTSAAASPTPSARSAPT